MAHLVFAFLAVAPTTPRISGPALTNALKRSPTMEALLEVHAAQRESFNHIHLSAFWARSGRLGSSWGVDDERAAAALQPILVDTLSMCDVTEFGCRQITGTAHGLAKGGFARGAAFRPLWEKLCDSALSQLEYYSPREISTTAWAYAKTGLGSHAFPELYVSLELEARGKLHDYTPQGLANLAWALAKAEHTAPAFFAELEHELQRPTRLADFSA